MPLSSTPLVVGRNAHTEASFQLIAKGVSTCNITAEYVVAGYGLISLPRTVKAKKLFMNKIV